MSGAQQIFLRLLHLSIVKKMHLIFAKRPTSKGSEWKYLIAQRGSYTDKDEHLSEHLPRTDTAPVLSSEQEHCASPRGPQANGIMYT